MIQPTHHIVEMTAGLTKGSMSPMWRCRTKDGERVNIFKHSDAKKNSYRFFEAAGYGDHMSPMQDGDKATWNNAPIGVVMVKNGDWWDVVNVAPRPEEAAPDPVFVPNLAWYKRKAIDLAKLVTNDFRTAVFFDTETTGTGPDAEIISIALVNCREETLFRSFIKPTNLAAVEHSYMVTGLTPADVASAPTWPDVYSTVARILSMAPYVVAYNINFDLAMVDQSCMINNSDPIIPGQAIDAVPLFSQYAGLWDKPAQRWEIIKLSEAAAKLGIAVEQSHDAMADTLTLVRLMHGMTS